MNKKIVLSILIIFVILSGIYLYLRQEFMPLREDQRNISTTDMKMLVKFEDKAHRTPIIRTYTQAEFDKLDEKELARVKEIVRGNIEGDVPALRLEHGKGLMGISFVKTKIKPVKAALFRSFPRKPLGLHSRC